MPSRVGDIDGANLPWFSFADSVLLFWWIHKENADLDVSLQWKAGPNDIRRLEIHPAAKPWDDPLLSIEIVGANPGTIVVDVLKAPLSSSPSLTYPIRVAIIHVIAPTAVFVNDLLGNTVGVVIEYVLTTLELIILFGLYPFLVLAVVFSFWRCLKGPSFEDTVERIQGRLERLSENERLRVLRIHVLGEKLGAICQNGRFMAVVDICRNGWHPERDRAVAAEVADVERGLDGKEKGEGGEKKEDTASKQ